MSRLFPILQPILTIIFIFIACIVYGLSLFPSFLFFNYVIDQSGLLNINFRFLIYGISLSLSFFIFGISLIILVGLIVRFLPIKTKPGIYNLNSIETIKWGICGAFLKLVNLSFLDFITPTFLNILYFRLIGTKIGKNVQINSININDPWLLEIGDNTVIGGSASINCHTVESGKLKLEKVVIGKKCTIGAKTLIWPGCEIGDKSVIAARSVLKKNTKVGSREIWKGDPAVNIRSKN
ncbi:MAG: hypothetical protein CMG11_02895 [Candidatus Marinimicrobia bacterium]|nr:hypothetical protein [Candidatus Neomarinimicrobiota bacterium]